MELDTEAAWAAVRGLGEVLGLDPAAAAAGVIDIVTENMLGALRVVTVQKGLTPSDFALVSFGGAGGLHANALAALLGCFPVLVPPESGVLSALGFVASEIRNEFSQTFIRDAAATTPAEISDQLIALAGRRVAVRGAGVWRRSPRRVRGRHALSPPGVRASDRAGRGRARRPVN
jgi:N-methylhydantoinase A